MKIAIITDIPFLYEDTMYLNELEKRLQKHGNNCDVFVVSGSNVFEKIDSASGIMRIIHTSRLVRKLSEYDVIHAQFTFPIGFSLALLASLRLITVPIVVHTHGYDVFTAPEVNYGIRRNRIGRFLTNYAWSRSKKIIAVCKKSKIEISASGISDEKIEILYNGVDELLFRNTNTTPPEEFGSLRNEADFLFLSIASLVPVKNLEGLTTAFLELTEKLGSRSEVKLMLIGNTPKHNSITLPKHSSITYLGKKQHRDLPYYYNLADAFVLPSVSEAHPWSLLEAMACELPVVASNVGGIPETIADKRFLIDPHDQIDILKKLEMIVELGSSERKVIGKSNREIILKSFTLSEHVNRLNNIFEMSV